MAEILIKAVSATNPDSTKDRRGCYKRGDLWAAMHDGHGWIPTQINEGGPGGVMYRGEWSSSVSYVVNDVVRIPNRRLLCIQDCVDKHPRQHPSLWQEFSERGSSEGLPDFVRIIVPDATVDQVRPYTGEWIRRISYTVVSSNQAQDSFRLRISANAATVNATSGEGKITRAAVENFLTRWNASVVSTGDNAVTFDIRIVNAINSSGFWGRLHGFVSITEQSYTQATGVHRTNVDYTSLMNTMTALGYQPADIRNDASTYVQRRGGTIISNNTSTNVAVVDFTRSDVRAKFEADVQGKVEIPLVRRQYTLPGSLMTTIEGAGGVDTMTLAELQAVLVNRIQVVA
jgi:hypothetical protein